MKKLTLILVLFPFVVFAQSAAPGTATAQLNVGGVNAELLVGSDMWWNFSKAGYEVPKGSGVNSIFAGAIWIGGYDTTGQLHIAAATYRQNGNDFFPGPLDSTGNTTTANAAAWNKIFVVYTDTVNIFRSLWKNNGGSIKLGQVPTSILNWPGKNNPHLALPYMNQDLAPFVDVNNDGKYDPLDGDYPKTKGDENIWWIINDKGNVHSETQGAALSIEMSVMAYANKMNGSCTDYTTFYDYSIRTIHSLKLDSVYIGLWEDFDIGYPYDDYTGSDTTRRIGIGYNGAAIDGPSASCYGTQPPVLGSQFLTEPYNLFSSPKHNFNFISYDNDFSVTGNPNSALEYYYYLTSRWTDGTPVTEGGNGYGGAKKLHAMFPSDPKNNAGWSECAANDPAGDRRFIMSFGPLTMPSGANAQFTMDVVWYRPPVGTYPCPSFSGIDSVADCVASIYQTLGTQPEPIRTDMPVTLYPNPNNGQFDLDIQLPANIPTIQLDIINELGQTIDASTIPNYNFNGLSHIYMDMRDKAPGVYFARLRAGNSQGVKCFIIQK